MLNHSKRAVLLLILISGGSLLGWPTPLEEGGLLIAFTGEATGWNNAGKLIVDDSGTIHIVYQQRFSSAHAHDEDLFLYASSQDGRLWEVGWIGRGRWPAIAFDPGTERVYIAFVERAAREDRLWVVSPGEGASPLLIAQGEPRSLFYPSLEAYKGKLYLAWEEHHSRGESAIAYAEIELPAEVGSWARLRVKVKIELIQESAHGLYFPSVAVGPDGAHLVWEEAAELNPTYHRVVHAQSVRTGWQIEPVSEAAPGSEVNARYPRVDYDPTQGIYELVFVGYASGGNRIYYRALAEGRWTELRELSWGLERGYWSFPVVEDGLVVWGRTVAAGCGVGPLYWSYRDLAGRWSEPAPLRGEFAAFPQLYKSERDGSWHLIWTDRDPESPLRWVIRYRRLHVRTAPSWRTQAGGGCPR